MFSLLKNWVFRFNYWTKNLSLYVRYPKLILIELTLFYFYQLYYSAGRRAFEVNEIAKPRAELMPGSTPLANLIPILSKIRNMHHRTFIDLGCGRGLLAMSIATVFKGTVIGIDLVPTYVRVANRLVNREKIPNISFNEGDFLLADLSKGDIFYATLTCLEENTILLLAQKLALIRRTILVITASAPLPPEYFKVVKTYPGYFSWGKGVLYIHKKR